MSFCPAQYGQQMGPDMWEFTASQLQWLPGLSSPALFLTKVTQHVTLNVTFATTGECLIFLSRLVLLSTELIVTSTLGNVRGKASSEKIRGLLVKAAITVKA